MTVSPFTRLAYSDASPGMRWLRRIGLALIVASTMTAAWDVSDGIASGTVTAGPLGGDTGLIGDIVVSSPAPLHALLVWFVGVRAADALVVGMAMLIAAFTMTTLSGPYRRGDRASLVRFLVAWLGAAALALLVLTMLPADPVAAAFAATLAAAATAIADAARTRTLYPLTLAGMAGAFAGWLSPVSAVAFPLLALVLVAARRGAPAVGGRWQFDGRDTLGAMFVVCMPAVMTPVAWVLVRAAVTREVFVPSLGVGTGALIATAVAVAIGFVVGAVAAHDIREDEPALGHAKLAGL